MDENLRRKNTRRYITVFIVMIALLIGLLCLNVCIGSVSTPIDQVIKVIFGEETNVIITKIRLPRLLAAALLGGALALSGFLLQTFFNNPIAGPFVLGISSGAKLFVAIVMIYVLGMGYSLTSSMLVITAFLGSMLSMGIVLMLSNKVSSSSMLIVGGVMIGYICSAITDFIVTFADESSIVNLHNWSMGSFSGMSWANVQVIAIVVLAGAFITFMLAKPISAYQLGEEYAQNMGVNIKIFRLVLVCLSSILSACVTAFAGPISFVGIAVPHLVKTFFKTSKPIIAIPACFLGGSIFCLVCDLIARTAFAPTDLSISSVTAIFGAPVVIWLMLKRRTSDR